MCIRDSIRCIDDKRLKLLKLDTNADMNSTICWGCLLLYGNVKSAKIAVLERHVKWIVPVSDTYYGTDFQSRNIPDHSRKVEQGVGKQYLSYCSTWISLTVWLECVLI